MREYKCAVVLSLFAYCVLVSGCREILDFSKRVCINILVLFIINMN